MSLDPGTRLGPYEITAPLGAGGMGEVYRARDTRLDRTVAIKILRALFSSDPVRKQRFEREAKTISGLNHPNICVLHDVGQQDGMDYLVMECIEGETLAKRLERGALPAEQVLKIGTEIADGLDKAHRSGVVHRDLKPRNIMLTKTGAKLLDFGLAKLNVLPSNATTLTGAAGTSSITEQGTIVGTFPYMSPEQVEGKELDGRSDIFSLGAVLYEMLTGNRAFEGKSQLSVASAILEKEPTPICTVKPLTPRSVDHIVRRCLAKDPDDRWQSARDLALELKSSSQTDSATGSAATISSSRQRSSRELLAWALAGLLALTAVFLLFHSRNYQEHAQQSVRASILPPPSYKFLESVTARISPDGRFFTFVAYGAEGLRQLWIRPVDSLTAKLLPGTDDALSPFWSSDGQWIAFFANNKLKKISVNGGTPLDICDSAYGRGGTWGPDGTILFAPDPDVPVYSVPAAGGTPVAVTQLEASLKEVSHQWPVFLPDGRHFLFLSRGTENAIYAAALGSTERKLILKNDFNVVYALPGYLLFVRNRVLMAQPFNAANLELTGTAVPVADDVPVYSTSQALFSVSQNGLLSIQTLAGITSQAMWVDRFGKTLDLLGQPALFITEVRISPNGEKVAFEVLDPEDGSLNLWVYNVLGHQKTRLTSGPSSAQYPVWSPDSNRIVFSSDLKGKLHLFTISATGVGQPALLLPSDQFEEANSWSPDGRYLVFMRRILSGKGHWSLWILPMFGGRKPYPLLDSNYEQWRATFSPDGKWLAFQSNETGRFEIYVVPFPNPNSKLAVSTEGGYAPRWSPDGKQLFYVADNGSLVAASLLEGKSGLQVTTSRLLFDNHGSFFDVAPDGKRFLTLRNAENQPVAPITLITNWPSILYK
jgi:serine/threonine protein kinase